MPHALKGRKQTPEHVAKRVAALRAAGVYQKQAQPLTERNKARAGFRHTEDVRRKMSVAHKGKQYALGVKRSEEFRRKLADYWAANREKHNHYKDGKGGVRARKRLAEMQRLDYRLWREAVFKRDDYTCQECGKHGGTYLQAHHLKAWATHPELRYDVTNGQTLCLACHRKTYGATEQHDTTALSASL